MMQDNLDLIREKVQDPTKKIILHDIGVVLGEINAMIADINAQIQANNDIVNAQADKKKECMRSVWEQLLFDLRLHKNLVCGSAGYSDRSEGA